VRRRITRTHAAVLVALGTAGGVAYATIPDGNKVYTACMRNGVGTIRLIDKSLPRSSLMSHCTSRESEIHWNQTGQRGDQGLPGVDGKDGTPGKDGLSVSSAPEPPGANCRNGGSKFMSASGNTYACNGAAGEQGQKGDPGPAGPPAAPVDTQTCVGAYPPEPTMELPPASHGWATVCDRQAHSVQVDSHLGTHYEATAVVTFHNWADLAFQDNRRDVVCELEVGGSLVDRRVVTLGGMDYGSLSLEGVGHFLWPDVDNFLFKLRCNVGRSGTDHSYVHVEGDVNMTGHGLD